MTQLDFKSRVVVCVKAIPRGSVKSYGEVALCAGSPGAARAVGSILKANADLSVPCHRVVRSDGTVGEYNGLAGKKEKLLREEGVHFSERGGIL
ncbi:MAG: MGMT family protein [Patescibacteria group bacterium]